MARWYVYVVRCVDGSLYTGISTDVAARVAAHNAGRGARYTRARRPVELVHTENKRSMSTALKREAAIKALPRAGKLALLAAIALVFGARDLVAKPARPDRVTVPAGPAKLGSTKGEEDERPVRTVVVKAFSIDRTEVTRGAYAACVAAKRCRRAPAASEDDGHLPMTNVSWADAQAYCKFAGGRLPTESEWEKAARGPDGREYPWGDELDCARANWGNFDGEGPCAGKNPGRPVAVGSYPTGASVYGALDLGGNVWEWTADKYDDDPGRRVVRGGSCCSYFVGPRAANRNAWAPEHRDADLGFRCAGAP
ncbi:MAG TPA: SUMF1/EgtB/PvdO family nonheme iron enzyme [Polyangia bacterium]|nr:SUMF1/EgtB/PvdO family nonheme iron enzyme [Polyangia bacterium]